MRFSFLQSWRTVGLLLLLLSPIVIGVFTPSVAKAVPVECPSCDAANKAIAEYEAARAKANAAVKKTFSAVVFTGLINLLQFASDRAAYTLASGLVSGAAAGDPLIEFRDAKTLRNDYFGAVAGEAVGLISEQITAYGGVLSNFNLCAPVNPSMLISLRLGVKAMFVRPDPICEFNTIKENWQGYIAQNNADFISGDIFLKNDAVLIQLADAFDPQINEFQVGVQLYSDILGKAKNDSDLAVGKLLMRGPTGDVVNLITGNVETPSSKIDYLIAGQTWEDMGKNQKFASMLTSNAAAFEQVGLHAASMFANTLLSKGMDAIFSGQFKSNPDTTDPFDVGLIALMDKETEQARLKAMYTSVPFEVTNFDALSEYASCPGTGNRGLYNCVMDSTFASAVSQAAAGSPMTVSEAIDEGLVNGGWALIPSVDKSRDQDPYCYTYGYCYSNLVKLRKARIIPDGWELAANSIYNSESSPVTLQTVIDGFDDCNSAGQPDESHNWCKMIDPNWILKYPDATCKNLAYGELLESSSDATRQQACVDAPSCISTDADGNCDGGYGYCVREDNVWLFRGDECPDYASSCLAFTDSDGGDANFITNTVDYGSCDSSNAGCLWYATKKALQGDGSFAWPTIADVAVADAAADAYESRIYFNSQVETCDADAAGCTALVERGMDLSLNLLPNSSFETDSDGNDLPDNWLTTNPAAINWDISGDYSLDLDAAINSTVGGVLYQSGLILEQSSFYTVSFYAKQGVDGEQTAHVLVDLTASNGETVDLTGTSYTTSCSIGATDNVMELAGTVSSTDFARFVCTFSVPSLADRAATIYADVEIGNGVVADVWIDSIQLEQVEAVTDYHDGYSSDSVTYAYANVPPQYLGCTGASTDAAECADYSTICAEQDVGCTEYTPTNGDPAVFGVVSSLDTCPASCNGYDSYKQEATLYEPDGDFPVYFIPESATSCNAVDAGCDEFTKLDDESLNYFTYLRACLTPEQDAGATYYTWEGSDASGYQLITWTLLESDLDAYTTSAYASGVGVETNPGKAPCTSWVTTASDMTCADDAAGDGHFDTDTETCDEHDDIFTNPDCREFYDTAGDIHYRLWSQTVTVNEACASYRKTDLVGLNLDSDGDGTVDNILAEDNCTNSGGFYDDTLAECIYYGYSEESTTCSAAANGCRDYTGGRSANSRVAFTDTLEDGDYINWDAASLTDVSYSNESVATDGHSLSALGQTVWTFMGGTAADTCADEEGCEKTAVSLGGICTVSLDGNYCGTLQDELYTGKTYTLSFWAKGTGSLVAGFDINAAPSNIPGSVAFGSEDAVFGTVTLSSSDWQEYSLGPLNMTAEDYADFGNGTVLAFVPGATDRFYLDNVVLREGEDSIDVIKDSWVTPAECDETPEGTASPQYYLGCQEYTSQLGDVSYEKSFSSLCSENKVGCAAYYETAQTGSPYGVVMGLTCSNLILDADGVPEIVLTATNCYDSVDSADATLYDTGSQFLCTIGVGFNSCSANIAWNIPADQLPDHLSYGPSALVVPADASLYLIVGDENVCAAVDAGCQEVGLPTFSQDRTQVTASTSTYLLNKPADYTTTLCSQENLFCEAWDAGENGDYYFKDPGNHTCEYRTGVTIDGVSYDGWFRTGVDAFCYGSGTCAESGDVCSLDSDCGSGDTCSITTGSYLIGGDMSGIWRNGDDDYSMWAGTCEAGYSTCSEFQDLLDIAEGDIYGESDGESYYYLDNNSLDESTLTNNEKCNGQVSQKAGCVLFNDTAVTAQTYNASASYIASLHADALFGDKPNALEEPISCMGVSGSMITTPSGENVDLCASRCAYGRHDIEDTSDDPSAGIAVEIIAELNTFDSTPFTRDEMYIFGVSCIEDTDCYDQESDLGEMVAGTCETAVAITRGLGTGEMLTEEAVPRLEDDSNRVLKVNRDRQCSEWLSCADSQQVWDARTSTYRTICGDIDLCDEYSGTGDASFCSSWVQDDVATTLDVSRYTSRDTSWYGHEYSGYAIPDLLPVQMLSQVNITPPPGYCNLPRTASVTDRALYQGDACTRDADCGGGRSGTEVYVGSCPEASEADYRLVFDAGSCDEVYGASCTVGYCSDTGSACSANDQCSSNECVIGTCYTVSLDDCVTSSDCDGDTCLVSGKCAEDHGSLSVGLECGEGQTLYEDIRVQTGTCINQTCLLTPDGVPVETGTVEAKDCRAYPESTSPFATEIVSQFVNPEDDEDPFMAPFTFSQVADYLESAPDMIPYSFITGFDNANVCNAGEDCSCSYRKITYGTGSATRYISSDTAITQATGVCVGGGYDGAYCTKGDASGADVIGEDACERGWDSSLGINGAVPSAESTDGLNESGDVKGGGTCEFPSQEDVILGLDGYCLERDTSINTNGNRDDAHRACLTWLPVDQLAGSTDLYGKDLSAGYFTETSVCSYTDVFVDLGPSAISEAYVSPSEASFQVACASGPVSDVLVGDSYTDNIALCVDQAICPTGYWALIGQPSWRNADANKVGGPADACTTGFNQCPYACIPFSASIPDTDDSCDPDSSYMTRILEGLGGIDNLIDESGNAYGYGGSVTEDDSLAYQNFGSLLWNLKDCRARGVAYTDVVYNDIFGIDDQFGWSALVFYTNLTFEPFAFSYWSNSNSEIYPACKDVVKVVDGSANIGFPFTDRILNEHSEYSIIDVDYDRMQFSRDITPYPYGAIIMDLSTRSINDPPIITAACWSDVDADHLNGGRVYPPSSDSFNSCDIDYSLVSETSPGNSLARAWTEFTLDFSGSYDSTVSDFYTKDDIWSVRPDPGTIGASFDRIKQIFAKQDIGTETNFSSWNGDWSSDGSGRSYEISSTDDGDYDAYDVRGAEGNSPKVWALNNSTCDGTQCEEGDESALTVNDQNSGDQEGAGGFFRAYLKFYAAADKNQLPLRRVIVDWGDGRQSGSDDDGNFYKNHRGLQEGTSTSICDMDESDEGYEWGMNASSCDPNYFSYNHNYTCNDGLLGEMEGCVDADLNGINDVSPCMASTDEGDFCVFTPKVHVRDNWGWCTGVCEGVSTDTIVDHSADEGNDGGVGCFDSVGSISSARSGSECAFDYYPTSTVSATDPWVHYDGAVYVKP
jgi:hypothetical protein